MVDFSLLEETLYNEFASKGWQRIEDIENFVKSDADGISFKSSQGQDFEAYGG